MNLTIDEIIYFETMPINEFYTPDILNHCKLTYNDICEIIPISYKIDENIYRCLYMLYTKLFKLKQTLSKLSSHNKKYNIVKKYIKDIETVSRNLLIYYA